MTRLSLALCAALASAGAFSDEPPRLDPVVVTGARTERSAFELPFAVSSVTAAELSAAGAQINLAEALARVPGIAVNLRSNYAQDLQISSRGYGARASFGVRGLRIYADGIPATAPDGQGQVSHLDLYNAERVEVLRGPFSALYGNSSGGVIALVSRAPEDDRVWAGGTVSRFGQNQFRGGAQTRFGDDGTAALSHSDFSVNGFRPHSSADRRLTSARLGFGSFVFTTSHLDQPAQDPLGLQRAQFESNPRMTAPQAEDFNTRKNTRQSQAGVAWRRPASGDVPEWGAQVFAGRREITQWLAVPMMVQQASTTHSGGVVDFDRAFGGAEIRARRQLGVLDLVAGLAYERQGEDRRGYENFIGTQLGVTGALRRDEANRAYSFDQFAQAEWSFAPVWTGTLGLRHGAIRFRSEDHFLSNGDDSKREAFSFWSPVAGIVFKATPSFNLHASAGRGFESPTLNELAYSSGLDPQTSRQFEVGGKLRLAAARLDVALFQADTDDELVVASNTGGRAIFTNAGRTRRRGAEAALAASIAQGIEARLAVTWLDARYRDGFAAAPAGNRLPATARTSAYGELSWAALPALTLAVEVRGLSRVAVNDANEDFAEGYGLLALRAEHVFESSHFRLRTLARLDNALDRIYAGSVIVNESNGRFFEPGVPRAAFLGLTLERRL